MTSAQCARCKHYIFNGKCEAFPEKIPQEIFDGRFTHNKKYKSQKNDILYKQIKES